ncbi:uncharacterized protein LOC115665748 [Syzygium oleosum]|uniref:uncharacterized protein LOC115665748 n=1 Tax=Syzygium oleosum TaxID=219896 RepID=UPI0011D28D76|nr:uncharacterized protein LOC115665748 [Syzygium oleosum]
MNTQGRGTGGASSSRARTAEDLRVDGVLRALEEIGQLIGLQTQERTAAVEAAAVAAQNNPGNGNGNENRQIHKLVEQFLKLKPSKFDGKSDPEAATRWIKELEKVFALLGCTEEEKVTLAVYQFQDNANDWWKATRERIFPVGMVLNWTGFVDTFNGKYFSESAQEQKMTEFLWLRQNQMTVDQYEAEFARLSKFAPRMVENPLDKARRFRDGLKPELRSRLIPLNLRDYNELYERA